MPQTPIQVGVIGCGNISSIYLDVGRTFEILNIAAVADLVPERAAAQAQRYGIARACTVEELLGDPSIDLVVNLTTPDAHAEVALAALAAGKSVYNEKPLAICREDGKRILDLARERGLRVGGAPDTFLGAGLQTCRAAIDAGQIGRPVAGAAFMLCHGHESWHPAPEFYYKQGGGPLFDMGPYYVSALVALLGPVRRVTGSAQISFAERTITSRPLAGKVIQVEVPTHVGAVLDMACGAVITLVTSFDVWAHHMPFIELYGTAGSLSVPDPNNFGGPVRVARAGTREWQDVPLAHGYAQNSRSLGVADLATALRTGRPARAGGEFCYHVLDVMTAILDASATGRHVEIASTCAQPAPLPLGLAPGTLDG